MELNTKLSITCSFFDLQSPDFAWKFVWTVRTSYKSIKVPKGQKYKVLSTQPFFELQALDFTWKFRVILLKLIQSLTLWHPKVEFQTLCFRVKNIIIYQSYIETEFINHIGPAQAPPFPYFLVVPNFGYVTR